jgi:hypothetical protein
VTATNGSQPDPRRPLQPTNDRPFADLDAMLDDVHLGALGLLDDDEQAALDEWMNTVSPQLRKQIIAEQLRMTASAPMITVDPDQALRARVIHAVLEAIRDAASAPAATATEPPVRTRRHTAGKPGVLSGSGGSGSVGSASPSHRRVRRTHPFWRTSTIGLAVLVIGMVTMHIRQQQEFLQLSEQAQISSLIDIAGAPALEGLLFDKAAKRVTFVCVDGNAKIQGMLWMSPETDTAHLYAMGLRNDPGVVYHVTRLDDAGQIIGRPVAAFTATGVIKRVDMPMARVTPGTMAIVAVRDGISEIIMTATVS